MPPPLRLPLEARYSPHPGPAWAMQLHGSGLSVLRHNAAYTVGDIVHHNGPDYLARSLHILSEPSQAGSLLHEWLLRTLRDEHGTRLDTIGSPDLARCRVRT